MAQALGAVERWGIYEIRLSGPQAGNPYTDVRLSGHFRYRNRIVDADGFYDGDGVYLIRFMPDEPGEWTYTTSSNTAALDKQKRRLHGHCSVGRRSRTGARPLHHAFRL